MNMAYAATTTSVKQTAMTAGVLGFIGGILLMLAFLALVWYALQLIANYHIFKKAGEKGWKGIIPFYNTYVQFSFSWKTIFFWILIGLSILAFVFQVIVSAASTEAMLIIGYIVSCLVGIGNALITIVGFYRLSTSFGHGKGWTVGLIFLAPVFLLMLAFGKSEYVGNVYLERKRNDTVLAYKAVEAGKDAVKAQEGTDAKRDDNA